MRKALLAAAIAVILASFASQSVAATNPFMDVPASHWAYDAVAQLASRGVISGYPDGSFKGAQPSTRYEMASIIARALANIDLDKASKQDVEMMRRLIVEFKDELDALGVRVDNLDERIAVLEEDIGGWSLAGELTFNAKFGQAADKGWYSDDADYAGENEFELADYVLWLRKRVNDTTNFAARLERDSGNVVVWANYYVTTVLPYDISLTVGLADLDWEGDLELYVDNEPIIGDWTFNMFLFEKDWGIANLKLLAGRANDDAGVPSLGDDPTSPIERFLVAGLADFNFSERFRGGLIGYWIFADEEIPLTDNSETDTSVGIIGAYAGFTFTPGVEGKVIYYHQAQGDTLAQLLSGTATNYDDSASAWKAILDVKQDVLKFTSVWVEYGQIDNNFLTNERFSVYSDLGVSATYTDGGASLLANMPINMNSTKIYGVRMDQEWNDKWRTYLRYFAADHDTAGIDDAFNWSVGVGYRLNDAVEFELVYDAIDYGERNGDELRNGSDNIVRFRTYVAF
ncbi:MAG: S-layer homology domain-containing protein [Synergistaceae bacterium]|nr:S-layer homology domain-containing protein [Synergistaceae bacterium]